MDQIFKRRTKAMKEIEKIQVGAGRGQVCNFGLAFKRHFPARHEGQEWWEKRIQRRVEKGVSQHDMEVSNDKRSVGIITLWSTTPMQCKAWRQEENERVYTQHTWQTTVGQGAHGSPKGKEKHLITKWAKGANRSQWKEKEPESITQAACCTHCPFCTMS